MADNDVIYVIDASSWISIEGHPAQNKILYDIVDLLERKRIQCPPESWGEVKQCPWVSAWLDQHADEFVVSHRNKPDYLTLIGEIFRSFPGMCSALSPKDKADPYVLANAVYGTRNSNPTKFVVVCAETKALRKNRKLPTACEAYQIEPLDLFGMLKREFPNDY